MWRDIRRHTNGDATRAVNEQVGDLGREHVRNLLCTVIVWRKIDRFFIEICQQVVGDFSHSNFGITHCRRGITVDRTEVTLAIYERIAQRKILRHAYNRVVNSGVPMRMVFTNHITHDTR